MKKREFFCFMKRGMIWCLIGMFMLESYTYSGGVQKRTNTVLAKKSKKETDYNKYSGKEYSWYIRRAKNHEKAGGGIPSEMNFSQYDAFYMNSKTKEKVIYLTFDCGYENGYTAKILKTLKKHKAKALFFVTGAFVRSNPELVKQMKRESHLVGNHTDSHLNMAAASVSKLKQDIKKCAKEMKQLTGYTMDPYLRPPMGCFSSRSLKVTADLGYKTIFWSMAYYDYNVSRQPGKDYVIRHFQENYHPGALPLIHNISSSNCAALPTLLKNLKKQKYRFGTVDEFALPKGKLKIACADKVYNGKPAKIKIVKNTNKKAKITYIIRNAKGKKVKKAVKPGEYTVVAKVESSRTYRYTTSNKVKFKIKKKTVPTPQVTTGEAI